MKLYFALGAAVLLAGAAAPNWTATVKVAPNGAYVMGNPAAKAKLVEYLSYTCTHCADFTKASSEPLTRDYVAKGLVSIEVRNAVRDRLDFTAALLARCGGPARFFKNSDALMAAQSTWLAKAEEFGKANNAKMESMAIDDSLKLITRGVGLDAVMKARGFTPAQLDVCLTDKVAQQKIAAMANEAWNERKIAGTPSFLINSKTVETPGVWAQIEPVLKAALAAKG
jgi:protein-disulfide isomerase